MDMLIWIRMRNSSVSSQLLMNREMLEYVNKLYSEDLIEENIYSIDTTQYLANASGGVYASTDYYSLDILFGEEVGNNYIGANALEGPGGIRQYSNITSPVMQPGAFVITSANENPVVTVRWERNGFGKNTWKFSKRHMSDSKNN